MAARNYNIEYLYTGDRWRTIGTRQEFIVTVREINGIVYGELHYHETPKHTGTYLFGGLPNIFAPLLKEFLRSKGNTVKKVRRRRKDRTGPKITLWW